MIPATVLRPTVVDRYRRHLATPGLLGDSTATNAYPGEQGDTCCYDLHVKVLTGSCVLIYGNPMTMAC